MLKSELKSFTISEMLVVMIVTTIVISMAILILNLVQSELKGIQLNFKNNTERRTLEQILWNDFNKSEILFNAGNNQIDCISPLDTVSYKFLNRYILRNNDTIKVLNKEKKLFLDMNESLTTIDALELKFSKEFQNKQLFIYKEKASSYYMNQNGI